MFEKATRQKLRFKTDRGTLTVEDMWDIPLLAKGNGLSLDRIAKTLRKMVKSSEEESFVVKKSVGDATLALHFNIVKHIIEVKLTEAEENEKLAASSAQKRLILEIIADKKQEGLKSKSIKELEALLPPE